MLPPLSPGGLGSRYRPTQARRPNLEFEKECQFYSDDNYFKQILEKAENESHFKKITKLPFWYIRAFNLKNIRLYGRTKFLKSYLKNTYENILDLLKFNNYLNFLIIFEHIIYLPIIITKILLKKLKIEKL